MSCVTEAPQSPGPRLNGQRDRMAVDGGCDGWWCDEGQERTNCFRWNFKPNACVLHLIDKCYVRLFIGSVCLLVVLRTKARIVCRTVVNVPVGVI